MPVSQILIIVYLICLFYLLIRLVVQMTLLTRWKRPSPSANLPGISIVIAARNMGENLKILVPKLMNQEYADFEVIICLDRCHDESLELMKKFETEYHNIKTVIIDELPDHFSPKKYALTLGVKGSKNEWILVTDADCMPNSDHWIQNMSIQMTEESDFVLGFSPYNKEGGFLNAFIRFETFQTAFNYLTSAMVRIPFMSVGRNMAFRKSQFLASRGYNRFQHIMGGDDDLFVQHQAKGNRTRIVIGRDAVTYSDAKKDLISYWLQKKRHFSVGKYYKPGIKFAHTLISIMMLLLWVLGISMAVLDINYWWIPVTLLGYYIIKGLIHFFAGRSLGAGYPWFGLPVFEAIYITLVPSVVLLSSFSKKVKWN